MRVTDPRHRYIALRDKTREPEDALERSLYVLLHGGPALTAVTPHRPWADGQAMDASLEYPWTVFNTPSVRSVLEAFLLSSDDEYQIGQGLAMPVEEVSAYRHLFFDTGAFRTDMELIVFLQGIPEDNPDKQLYMVAFHQGLGALRWHYCRNKGDIEPEEVAKTIMMDTYYRFLSHRGAPLTSKIAREAMKLARISLDGCRVLLADEAPHTTETDSLKIQFENTRKNRTLAELQQDNGGMEILH